QARLGHVLEREASVIHVHHRPRPEERFARDHARVAFGDFDALHFGFHCRFLQFTFSKSRRYFKPIVLGWAWQNIHLPLPNKKQPPQQNSWAFPRWSALALQNNDRVAASTVLREIRASAISIGVRRVRGVIAVWLRRRAVFAESSLV